MTAPARGDAQRVLVCRTDNDGDVLLAGPAVAAVAQRHDVAMLVSAAGEAAARLLPGVGEVHVSSAPWSGFTPPPVDASQVTALVETLRSRRFDAAVVLTSYHQSPLPLALILRLAGIAFIAAASEDYPGSLLDVRLPAVHPDDPRHEVERALATVRAAGLAAPAPPEADSSPIRLAVRTPLPSPPVGLPEGQLVVVHPGASVPARAPLPQDAAAYVAALSAAGWRVVVTGGPQERELTAAVAGDAGLDLGGRTTLAELAAVLSAAACVVVGNTGPAHLAAAVGTPVVSLFSPVVPRQWWAPWGVPVVVLGDQRARCAGTRARQCPVEGHPCLATVAPHAVVGAVAELADGYSRTGLRGVAPIANEHGVTSRAVFERGVTPRPIPRAGVGR
jgi:ADP-heptose:LPS heptosyltransferase